MKVLYDYQAFMMQVYGGVSNSFVELIAHLPDSLDFQIGVRESDNVHLKEKHLLYQLNPCRKTVDNFICKRKIPFKRQIFNLWNQLLPLYPSSYNINKKYSIDLLKEGKFDVFHPTFFDDYFLDYLGGKPFVLTVHDMIPELFPQYFNKRNVQIKGKEKLVKRASRIITVSEKTKQDMMELLHVPEKKITTIYHGAPNNSLSTLDSPIVKGGYFLYVGDRKGYKNFIPMIKEFCLFLKFYPSVKLICTGNSFTSDELILLKKMGVYSNVMHMFVDENQLMNLYRNAIAFIYPSLYEGFGIPILEAFSMECPVLLNDKSCFPEIAAGAGMLFCLDEHKSNLVDVLKKVINFSENERKQLIIGQNNRLKDFSWEASAVKLSNLYAECC